MGVHGFETYCVKPVMLSDAGNVGNLFLQYVAVFTSGVLGSSGHDCTISTLTPVMRGSKLYIFRKLECSIHFVM